MDGSGNLGSWGELKEGSFGVTIPLATKKANFIDLKQFVPVFISFQVIQAKLSLCVIMTKRNSC